MALKIKEEVQKQLEACFLSVINYPPWIANFVPIPKKDGKVRMCVDYRDLNKASPKDAFKPLTKPGLGVEIDEAKVIEFSKNAPDWRNPLWRHEDNSVAEW